MTTNAGPGPETVTQTAAQLSILSEFPGLTYINATYSKAVTVAGRTQTQPINPQAMSGIGPNVILGRVGRRYVALPIGGGVQSVQAVVIGNSASFAVGDKIALAPQNGGASAVLVVTQINPAGGGILGLAVLTPGTLYGTAPTQAGAVVLSGSGTIGTATFATTLQGFCYPAVTKADPRP